MGEGLKRARAASKATQMTPAQRDMMDLLSDVIRRIHEGSIVKFVIVTTDGHGECRVASMNTVTRLEVADILSRAGRNLAANRTDL